MFAIVMSRHRIACLIEVKCVQRIRNVNRVPAKHSWSHTRPSPSAWELRAKAANTKASISRACKAATSISKSPASHLSLRETILIFSKAFWFKQGRRAGPIIPSLYMQAFSSKLWVSFMFEFVRPALVGLAHPRMDGHRVFASSLSYASTSTSQQDSLKGPKTINIHTAS